MVECLRSGWITTGPKTRLFEQQFAAYTGSRHALAVTSGTAGEHLALLALGIGPGDEVITTPMTWASTVNLIVLAGATPVLVDVDPRTYNINPAAVEARLSERTRAIIPVHFAGLPCDMDALTALAGPRGLTVIEDAAHAVGTLYKGRPVGAKQPGLPAGRSLSIFSFHPIKNITTGEGGMITTDDDELADAIRLLRFHGITREAWQRYGRDGKAAYEILRPGFKYNMMDMQAALGLAQLSRIEGFIARRTELAQRYLELLADVEEIQLPAADAGYPARHAWHLFTILVETDRLEIDRQGVMDALKAENIGTGLHFTAVHLHPFYQETLGFRRGDFPNAERISDRILSLPLFPQMVESDVDDVVKALKRVLHRHRK